MIQDIYPDRLDNRYMNCAPASDSLVMSFRDGNLLARYDAGEAALRFPTRREFPLETQTVYLFSIAGECFFLDLDGAAAPEGYDSFSMRDLRALSLRSNTGIFAAYTAFHLWNWYRTSRFCGACGGETSFSEKERAMICPKCGNVIYPRINPAVIIGVTNGNRLLLTRYRTGFAHNALVAGFTEIGETLEETVRREVMEEVGLRVRNIRYYKSQPWGVASDILAGFYCDVDGDDAITRDDSELKYAEWVERQDIVLQPSDYSLTNEMMHMFKRGAL